MEQMSILDITTRKFSSGRRGYNRREVDEFIERVAGALQREREELRKARHRIEDLEERLETARVAAEEGPETVLQASDMKQRLIEDATERAVQILRAGYAATIDDEDEIQRRIAADRGEMLAIWEFDEEGTPVLDLPSDETRYHRRSAHLPHLGSETARVLDDVNQLRESARRNR